MTDKWQSGRTYVPGSFVIPTKGAPTKPPPITNGDFETGDATGWTLPTPSSWAVVSNDAYSGTHSLKYIGDADGDGGAISDSHIPVTPGQWVHGAAMFKATHNADSFNTGQLAIQFLDGNGNPFGTAITGNHHGDGGEQGGAWLSLTVSAAAPAGAESARLLLWGANENSSGYCNFDNCSLTTNAAYIPDGLIYEATQTYPGKSGATEPSWPGQVGVPVTDNEVTWEGRIATSITWQAEPIMKTGDTEPTWPTVIGGAVRDGTVNWTAISRRITDENCPNSKVVAIMASKVFAADGDIVRFSATTNPLDWTSEQNAGYLPTGLQQANANEMAVLAPYRSNLCTFNASSFQNWQVDPDPAAMAILDQMEGIGSTHQKAAQPVGNELFYLSQLGVRTVSIAGGADNLKAGDVGMPIDPMVQEAIESTPDHPRATYYPSSGQYWVAFHNYVPMLLAGRLPDGGCGDSIDYQYGIAGGMPPYRFYVADGKFPDGLTLHADGSVTGEIAKGGSYAWTVGVEDNIHKVATLHEDRTGANGFWNYLTSQLYPLEAREALNIPGGSLQRLRMLGANRDYAIITGGRLVSLSMTRTVSYGTYEHSQDDADSPVIKGGSLQSLSMVQTVSYGTYEHSQDDADSPVIKGGSLQALSLEVTTGYQTYAIPRDDADSPVITGGKLVSISMTTPA